MGKKTCSEQVGKFKSELSSILEQVQSHGNQI